MKKTHMLILVLAGTLLAVCLWPALARAAEGDAPAGLGDRLWAWWDKVWAQAATPLFWFGMGAQFMFFMRFIWQWIVSERRGHSTVPIAFWYFSLAGGVALFVYAALLPSPPIPIMLGQALACLIYGRNLSLIYGQAARRKRAGLPRVKLRSVVNGETDPEEEK